MKNDEVQGHMYTCYLAVSSIVIVILMSLYSAKIVSNPSSVAD